MAGTLRRVAAFARPVVHSGYRAAARLGERAAFRVDPYKRPFTVRYEYPPSATEAPMYGWGRPNHPGIDAALGEHVSAYESQLDAILRWEAELSVISVEPTGPGELVWRSSWLGALDIASLYTVVRDRQPRRYHEVGSGNSTKVAAMARADGGLDLRIRSVDPQPRAEIDAICDEVLRQPFELVADRFVAEIEPGDVVFIDCSHRLFSGSDTTVFWLDVLPRLPVGTVVGVHDIHWPQDYPAEWREFLFNE
ncbi:MAG TPA: class I SAM-dependent methyltransferase, partial [Acidimicrobiales bacterium]|nr:class I SAM-dependent methyltransferase [Acidimicrobiales bacterium]